MASDKFRRGKIEKLEGKSFCSQFAKPIVIFAKNAQAVRDVFDCIKYGAIMDLGTMEEYRELKEPSQLLKGANA